MSRQNHSQICAVGDSEFTLSDLNIQKRCGIKVLTHGINSVSFSIEFYQHAISHNIRC